MPVEECNIYCIATGMDVTFNLNMINAVYHVWWMAKEHTARENCKRLLLVYNLVQIRG